MKRPQLHIDATGRRYLVVWFCPGNRDYTKIIRDAFELHKISAEDAIKIPVVVLPVRQKVRATQKGSPTRRSNDEKINTRARLRPNS